MKKEEYSKVYLSGPISGVEGYEKHFRRAEEQLAASDWQVINPAKNHGCETYKEYMDMALFQLMQCDTIYMLAGWQNSNGAQLEHRYAELCGLRIMYEE